MTDIPADAPSEPPAPTAHPFRRLAAPDSGFLALLALYLAFRLLSLFLLRPGGFVRDWSDFDTFLGIASTSDYGLYPFVHYWLEWPPLVPWLAVGAYRLSLLIPPCSDDYRLWFVLILGGIFALFETGNLVLLHRIAGRLYGEPSGDSDQRSAVSDQPPAPPIAPDMTYAQPTTQYATRTPPPWLSSAAARPVLLYALLFVPLYAMLGFFDTIALFCWLLALDWLLRDRLLSSAAALGAGFLVKLTPIVAVPVAMRRLAQLAENRRAGLRDGALYAVGCALTILVILLPFALTRPAWLLAAARAVAGRSSWETVWAVMEGYFGFGAVGGDRLNPAETAFAVHPSTLPWALIGLAFAAFYLLMWTRPADYRKPRAVVGLTGFTVTLFLLYSKGYSPQFLVYLLPFVVLLFPNGRGVAYALLLTLLNVLEQPVYFVLVPQAGWLLTGIVAARWVTLGALLLEFGSCVWPLKMPLLGGVRRYAPAALWAAVFAGLVAGIPGLARAYMERQLAAEPAAPLIGYLATQQAAAQADRVWAGDQAVLRHLTPYLGGRYTIRLLAPNRGLAPDGGPDGERRYPTAPGTENLVDGVTAAGGRLWAVTAAGDSQNALNRLGRALLTYQFDGGYQLQLFSTRGDDVPLPSPARLANGADLIGYQMERPARGQVRVALYWLASGALSQSYTVFTQVLGANGEFLAGDDGIPAHGKVPTHTWQPQHVIADAHLIQLPANLPPGRYRVLAGMYDVNLTRVVAVAPDAEVFPDNAVPLGDVELP